MGPQPAIKTLLVLLACVVLLHLCILAGIIPYHIAWGGRLQSVHRMYTFESISIIINLALISVLLIKGGYIRPYLSRKTTDIILWAFVVLLLLNTAGNLFAKTIFEKSLAIVTLALALLVIVALRKHTHKNR